MFYIPIVLKSSAYTSTCLCSGKRKTTDRYNIIQEFASSGHNCAIAPITTTKDSDALFLIIAGKSPGATVFFRQKTIDLA